MSNPRKKSDMPMTESMKIRHYIMDIIYHGGKSPVKLLSLRKMAEKFGVACSTVSLVLDKLEQEGFITARHGVGYFTKPKIEANWGKALPLIGLVMGYGKHFFYGADDWSVLAYLGLGLTAAGFNVRHLQLSGISSEAVLEELKNSYLDGVVWVGSDEVTESLLQNMEAAGIAVVTVNTPFPSINNISYDGDQADAGIGLAAAAIMNRLIREQDRRVEHLTVS